MDRTFGIVSARDQLERLRQKVEALRADDLNESLALEAACVAWDMCDWTFRDHGASLGFGKLLQLQAAVRSASSDLAFLQDVCIESKHAQITRYTPRIDRAEHYGGAFSNAFSRDFNISKLQIVVTNGPTLWFIDVADAALAYWESFYSQHGL